MKNGIRYIPSHGPLSLSPIHRVLWLVERHDRLDTHPLLSAAAAVLVEVLVSLGAVGRECEMFEM